MLSDVFFDNKANLPLKLNYKVDNNTCVNLIHRVLYSIDKFYPYFRQKNSEEL